MRRAIIAVAASIALALSLGCAKADSSTIDHTGLGHEFEDAGIVDYSNTGSRSVKFRLSYVAADKRTGWILTCGEATKWFDDPSNRTLYDTYTRFDDGVATDVKVGAVIKGSDPIGLSDLRDGQIIHFRGALGKHVALNGSKVVSRAVFTSIEVVAHLPAPPSQPPCTQ